jgi:outer membrane receptor protein involved in Fe transport
MKVTLFFVFMLSCFFLLASSIALAVETPVKEEKKVEKKEKEEQKAITYELEVVAKRTPENRFETNRSVVVMGNESAREQLPRTVPEALNDTPGTFTQQTNMGGGSPIIRGMIGPQLLIMVDGIRFNNSTYRTGPGQYLNLVDPLSIERIEILRGPGSVLYGSDAMGGVIQLSSLSAAASHNRGTYFDYNLLSRYMSANNGGTLHGNFALGSKDFTFLGAGTYKKFNDLRGGGDAGIQPHVGYNHSSAFGKGIYRFRNGFLKDWSFTVGYLYSFLDDAGRTDKLYDKNSLQIYDNIDHLVYGRLHMVFPGLDSQGGITISYQDFFELKDNHGVLDDYQTITKTTRDEVRAGTLGLDINMTTKLKVKGLRVNYGAMWYRDSVGADRLKRTGDEGWIVQNDQNYPDGSTYSNFGLYSFVEWDAVTRPSGGALRLSGGYRLHGMSANVPAKGELPQVDFTHTGHVFLFSAQYLFNRKYNISLTFSQGFRSPNLQESVMLGDTGKFFHVPNYRLEPEKSDTVELLTRARFGQLIITWTGYVSFIKDFIKRENTLWQGQSEIDGKDVVFNVNAGKGFLWGTETSFLLGFSSSFSLSGHATYTWGEERVENGANIPLTRIPPLFGQVKIRYDLLKRGKTQGFVEGYVRAAAMQDRLSAEDISDNRIPPGGTPGWWTLNFRAGVLLFSHIRLNLALENVFNKKYKYHASGIYSPGAQVVLGLEIL